MSWTKAFADPIGKHTKEQAAGHSKITQSLAELFSDFTMFSSNLLGFPWFGQACLALKHI